MKKVNRAGRSRLIDLLSGTHVEDRRSSDPLELIDNLAIALAFYFTHHMDRPRDDDDTASEENGDLGQWVKEKTDRAIELLATGIESHLRLHDSVPVSRAEDNACGLTPKDAPPMIHEEGFPVTSRFTVRVDVSESVKNACDALNKLYGAIAAAERNNPPY